MTDSYFYVIVYDFVVSLFHLLNLKDVPSLYYSEHTIKIIPKEQCTRNILLCFQSTIGLILHTNSLCIHSVLSLSFIVHQKCRNFVSKNFGEPLTNFLSIQRYDLSLKLSIDVVIFQQKSHVKRFKLSYEFLFHLPTNLVV